MTDFACAASGIVVTTPVWLTAMIGIQISDPGPVFYMAKRVGKNNVPFSMFKFRSMRVGKANESVFRGEEDRIFPFGQAIRALKIDELPQLLNIMRGEMGIVGPRPAAVDQMEITRGGIYARAASITPGLTGPSALYDYIYGDEVSDPVEYETMVLPTRMKLDLVYLDKMSPVFDIKMILWTLVCIMSKITRKPPEKMLDQLIAWAEEVQTEEQN